MYINGQKISTEFIIRAVEEKTTKTGKPYKIVELINAQGVLPGKIWHDAYPHTQVQKNTVAIIEGEIQEYQGALSLVITSAKVKPEAVLSSFLPVANRTPTMVFDIETVGKDLDQLSELQKEYLFNKLEKDLPPEEAASRTGLHPLFAEVGYIALLDVYQKKGAILGQAPDLPHIVPQDSTYTFTGFSTERELLEAFWNEVEKYQQYVTYNGNSFDWPFLIFRSAVQKVRIPIEIKLHNDAFIDLQKKMRPGGSRAYSLEIITHTLGLTNPKEAGVAGNKVTQLYREGKHQDIVDYVGRDVIATMELYHVWAEYLAGKIII